MRLSFLKIHLLQNHPWSIGGPQKRSYLFWTFSLIGASFLKLDLCYLGFWCFSVWMTVVPHIGSHSSLCLHPKFPETSFHSSWQLLNVPSYWFSFFLVLASKISRNFFSFFLTVAQRCRLFSQSEFLSNWNPDSTSVQTYFLYSYLYLHFQYENDPLLIC